MAELYLAGVLHTAAEKWLGAKPGGDGITWFDLLALPEETTAPDVKQRVAQRGQQLEQLAARAQKQGREDYLTIIGQLSTAVDSAAATLGEDQSRQDYVAALKAFRENSFEKTIAPSIAAGRKPDGAQLSGLLNTARQLRLAEATARRIIDRLVGLEGQDNPEVGFGRLRASDLASFGVLRVSDDRAWPTYFDVLQIDESTNSAHLIHSQAQSQAQRARERESKFTEMEQKRRAREFLDLVESAERTLTSSELRAAHLREIQQKRGARLREEIQLLTGGDGVSAESVIRLLAAAQRMRLPDTDARQVITAETGFADYFGLVGERRSPVLSCAGTLKVEIERPDDADAGVLGLTIRNEGGGTLEGRITPAVEWIQVEPASISATTTQSVKIEVSAKALPRGVPTTGQVLIETNGGTRIVTVEATVAGSQHPQNIKERVWGGVAFLIAISLIGPVIMTIVFQRRSRYVAFQAAQSAVLGAAFWAVVLGTALGHLVCIGKLLETPGEILSWVILAAAGICGIASFCGRGVWLPLVADRAAKFL